MKISTLAGSLLCGAMLLATQVAHAKITVYTNQAAYLAAVGATWVDTYDDLPASFNGPVQRGSGDHAYTLSSHTDSIFPPNTFGSQINQVGGRALVAGERDDIVKFSGLSSNVRGIAGFFNLTASDTSINMPLLLFTATDTQGTQAEYYTWTDKRTFVGFVSDVRLNDFNFWHDVDKYYPYGEGVIDDLHISLAAPVPEASSWAMLAAGLGLLGGVGRRRRPVTLA